MENSLNTSPNARLHPQKELLFAKSVYLQNFTKCTNLACIVVEQKRHAKTRQVFIVPRSSSKQGGCSFSSMKNEDLAMLSSFRGLQSKIVAIVMNDSCCWFAVVVVESACLFLLRAGCCLVQSLCLQQQQRCLWARRKHRILHIYMPNWQLI